MKHEEIIIDAQKWMQAHFEKENTGHDWEHVKRVWHLSKQIQATEGGDKFVIELAALFHDYNDSKLTRDPLQATEIITHWMKEKEVPEDVINKIIRIIQAVSFKNGKNPIHASAIEEKIVQDADRLDAIGAIGIARTFTYGGAHNREIVNRAHPENTTLQHFYDKLLLIQNQLKTKTGRELAAGKQRIMQDFIHALEKELEI
ncbi:HD domain-containing protein [Listeria sp. FSL L7-0091]|uniref:HD domain-containing protein n=1 Tax=Listeria farberi TaxID=2713500 RepID=A0A7X0ZIK5_9LIST|nr:HD domain-containing protein [Listeria farberi]MBC1376805.1 HD domain-containing protein [Listeria farberi]MBC1382734.1 HD domain-containing protein [Listeria farberi]MBC2260314.1 HD domain-containing protein [Listeria farberi]MBC2287622.1 HD domain-containing protein [Listeria farberi]